MSSFSRARITSSIRPGRRTTAPGLQCSMAPAASAVTSWMAAITVLADEPFKPNGLCFSPDFRKVCIADTGLSRYPRAKSVIVSNLAFDGSKRNRLFMTEGTSLYSFSVCGRPAAPTAAADRPGSARARALRAGFFTRKPPTPAAMRQAFAFLLQQRETD